MPANALSKRSFHLRPFVLFLATTLGSCAAGWLLGGLSHFQELKAPPLMLSTSIWSFLQIIISFLMSIAAYLVWKANDIDSGRVLRLYLLHLVLQLLWMLFFLRLEWRLFAFFWCLMTLGLTSVILTGFRYINKTAYRLMMPQLIFLLFSAYINLGYYLFN